MMPLNQVIPNLSTAFYQGVSRGPDLIEQAVLLAVSAGSGIIVPGSATVVYQVGAIGIDIKNVVKEFFAIARNQEMQLENEANNLLERVKVLRGQAERDQENLKSTQDALKRSYAIEQAAQTIILEYEEEQQELVRRLEEISPQINEVQTMCSSLEQMAAKAQSPKEIGTAILASIQRIKQMREEIADRKAQASQPETTAPIIYLRA